MLVRCWGENQLVSPIFVCMPERSAASILHDDKYSMDDKEINKNCMPVTPQ